MKKLLLTTIASVVLAVSAFAQAQFRNYSFLSSEFGPYQTTNAACSVCYTTAPFGGIIVTQAAAAPFGGFTNLLSPAAYGTNTYQLNWTNHNGVWVIPTNAANPNANTTAGVMVVTNNNTMLVQDIPLWVDRDGRMPVTVTTNTWLSDGNAFAVSPVALNCRIWGAASAANTLNLIFVPLYDGTNECTGATPSFQWGITAAAGTTVVSTNFPIWKFAGAGKIRLRSATLTTTAAANIGVTIQSLSLSGFVP